MGFLGVYSAVYDYQPQGEGELEIREGDLLFILEKSSEDDWWKAKKKAERDDEDEPEGLVPNNYVEEAQPAHHAKALFDYTRQTDEEVSFSEDADILVYDTSDPDWTLVGVNSDFGFAPSNYIEIIDDVTAATSAASAPAGAAPLPNPAAAAIANIIHQQHASANAYAEPTREEPPAPQLPIRPSHEDENDRDEESPAPALPRRPPSEQATPPMPSYSPDPSSPPPRPQQPAPAMKRDITHVKESPPYNRAGELTPRSPSGYHIYNINEMVEVMGKRKKKPTTLGINLVTGIIFISPEGDDHQQEWTAEKLTHYSIEHKHVFVDLVRPSRSIDFHAGAKDTAQEIVAALGEIAGAYRAEGLREVLAAGEGGGAQKKGQILYDFMAQGDDEVTVAVGDEVAIIDDTKSEEWWMVRRLKNGREGVVPSSYVEIIGFMAPSEPSMESTRSTVERNRADEARLAKAAIGKPRTDSIDSNERHKRDSKRDSKSKSKPDPSKVRKWTDRSKAFTVEAQFIGLLDGKIQLHKVNGIKIAVPVAKMSVEDLEYVERTAGVSLDEDKPLSSIRARSTSDAKGSGSAGATVKRPEYDWFDFFLKAGVGPHQCERYAQNFLKDSMDESILPDITPETLRSLGLKEGDILRVMKYLDSTLGRTGSKSKLRNVSFGGEEVIGNGEEGGLFAGPGGMLRNNTRKGRPAPSVQAGDVVDPKAFQQADESVAVKDKERSSTPPAPAAEPEKPVSRGFDDDAWEVKQPKQPASASPPPAATASAPAAQAPIPKQVTGAMADLTLLQAPLQPTPAQPTPSQPVLAPPALEPQQTAVQTPPIQQPQQTGATPSLFAQVAQIGQHQARQRPQPPQTMNQNSLLPPPPQRPLSAPQNFSQQQSSFGPPPLQPQLTGVPQPGPAPPGHSLTEPNQQRFQPQATGFMGQNQFQNGVMPQPTGFTPQSQFGIQQQQQQQQPFINGPSGFQGMAPQPTGFGYVQPQQPMQTGINSVLPPALQPQPTGANGFGNTYTATNPPPVPPIPQQPTATPLSPQKTGPAPAIRFGVKPEAPKKLAPQPTGLRANLSQATPTNPFGF
ncbi:Actin cytoskeleton-regulatory complex protein sla1 [Penicillium macrosclerotiorum]|uniref:Actin cytoskeleton-regulatory complex protein sla1 n=1 Tax=Penicillium macrosclerotiorum TaxID=303699 RepID=UPI0025476924|nr:Actin cytoskeleton-regulatory complex protein sla1 [Penicillium macrosclerotiorum]KAJ5664741.1 Actin cytoskeleton-regulatory complex protein sla1 [Penicillium macrosclerotiorum]